MIEVENLSKRFGDTLAVDAISFSVRPGHVTGFLGPNGAGKSTTMRMLLGLDRPTSGTAHIGGRPYAELASPIRTVGAMLDAGQVHPQRTAAAHLTALAETIGEGRTRVHSVLGIVGLGDQARKKVGTFSLGMRQRLGIAAALLGDPAVIVLDEPMNGLDPDGIIWVRSLMRDLANQGRTVFVSSHLMGEMAQTADHLVVVGRGRLVADVATEELLRGQASVIRVRTPEPARFSRVLGDAGATIAPGHDGTLHISALEPARVARLALDHRIELHELVSEQRTLEDAFLELTHDATEYRATPATDRTVSR